jgi:predicted nucleotidyltransferase
MRPEPYWESPDIGKTSLTEYVSTCALQPVEKILEMKRRAASKMCSQILRKDSGVEVVALLGSVARGDIVGWFSDIDTLVITGKPREEEMIVVDHQPLFIERHSWASFEDLIVKKIARDEYEERSSYLSFYGNPSFLHSSRRSRAKYEQVIKKGTEALWREHSQIEEYLDDFVWFYGSAKEAMRYDLPLTAMGKLQRGITLLLRHYLIKNRILLRKPLPEQRTITQLRNSQVPRELVDFLEQMYRGKSDMETLLQRARRMYLKVTNGRRWFKIVV